MEPSSSPTNPEHGNFALPKPEQLTGTASEATAEQAPASQEASSFSKESMNQNQGMTLPPVVNTTPVAAPSVATPQAQPQPVHNNAGSPAIAADNDVIEKEWVSKIEEIVAHTQSDPYLQEKEISKLQADYLKKRYGKEIKLSGK